MHAKVNKITQEICDAVAVSVGSDGDGRLPNRDGVRTLRTASVWCGGGGPTEKQKASGQTKRVQVHEIPIHDQVATLKHKVGGQPQSRSGGGSVQWHGYPRGGVSPLSDVGRGVLRMASRIR